MTDPALDPSVLEKLYHSGAWLCLAILVAFFGLRAAKSRIAWLQEDHHAVWASAILGGLALLVVPATQGTTPNLSMLIAALVTVVSLHADPKKTPEEQKQAEAELPPATVVPPKQAGFVRLGTMIAIAAIGAALLFGCSTGASRQSTLGYALATATAISADMTPQNDALIQADIQGRATSQAAGDATLNKYEAARDKVLKDVPIVLDAIGAAFQLNDDASMKTATAALATLLADVVTMKGTK